MAYIYHILEQRRIVFSYLMHIDHHIHSVSLSTVEFEPDNQQTDMTYTEQICYLDGTGAGQGAV